jgi:hypothetical protein
LIEPLFAVNGVGIYLGLFFSNRSPLPTRYLRHSQIAQAGQRVVKNKRVPFFRLDYEVFRFDLKVDALVARSYGKLSHEKLDLSTIPIALRT